MITIIGVEGIPEIRRGDRIGRVLAEAISGKKVRLERGDVLVVTSKIVSKAEGRLVSIEEVSPSQLARNISRMLKKDPRVVELILSESKRIVRMSDGIAICETKHGFVCANAGVDQSNVPKGCAALLPLNPDLSARRIRRDLKEALGVDVAVILSDTFGRPWREGQVNVAVGVSGMRPLKDYRGQRDTYGYTLKVTAMAVADELASAAELEMGKLKMVPAVIVKGCQYSLEEGGSREIVRAPAKDIFK